jgi:hypothetical protein
MSLSTDVLGRATATRLICRGGRWSLELTRLEAVDRDVFQPRLTRLEGPESILAALKRSDEGQHLVTAAAQLMRSPRSDEDRTFEVSEGDWVPSADAGAPPRVSQSAENDAADTLRAFAELRAELAVLRASHSRLRDRVIALEAAQSGNPQTNVRAARGSRSQRRRSEPPPAFSAAEAAEQAFGENPGFAATQASPGLAPPAASPSPAAAGLPAPPGPDARVAPAPSFDELARAVAGEQPLPLLTLPTLQKVNECLATLMGDAPTLERAAEAPLDVMEHAQACRLLDDEGRERGAILLDLRAAVLLGAALLALPRDEALRQVSENEPSEDALLAMSEICNNLTGPVNAVAGNAHVRSTALSGVDVSTLPKLRARLDIAIDGGRMLLCLF